jgi:uncharacterized protein
MANRPPKVWPKVWQNFQNLDFATKGLTLGLALISLGGVSWFAADLWVRHRSHHLVFVAGSASGESFILAQAIAKVVEAEVPRVTIEVQESKGTSENLERIEAGTADLATAQADVPAGKNARTVAILYPDSFQLIVQRDAKIQQFSDLKGKRIGLYGKGGQYNSFMEVAEHFGLTPPDFGFIGEDDQSADRAFQQKQVDAVFRVRAIGNAQVAELVKKYGGRLVPIEQGDAMRVKHPAFESIKLPKGAYQGSAPTVPDNDLATIAVQRLLIGHQRIDQDTMQKITMVLNERRREIINAIPNNANAAPLVSSIRQPDVTGGTGIPAHAGAAAYYDRDKPSFIQQNAEYLGLILTVTLLGGSWLWELKRWTERGKKDVADDYIERAIALMNACQQATITPREALTQLDLLFEQIATELVREGISQESFRTFNEAYKTVREVIVRKGISLKAATTT